MLSKIVPRAAGRTTGAFVCTWPSFESEDARTVVIHAARASSTPKARRTQTRSRRRRELTTRVTRLLPREIDVARVRRGRRHETQPLRGLLDAERRARAR